MGFLIRIFLSIINNFNYTLFNMFILSINILQRDRESKPIQKVDELFKGIGSDNFVEPVIKVEMSTAFSGSTI